MATADAPEPAPGPRQYEFTPEQDRLFADLGSKMGFAGIFFLVLGVVGIAAMIYVWIAYRVFYIDVSSIVLVFVGLWTIGAARSFRDVAATRGRDISHLMSALTDLHSLYALLYWILIVAVFLFALSFVLVSVAH
jgi:hypothetical protein